MVVWNCVVYEREREREREPTNYKIGVSSL